jgi:hypothetical protein
MHTANTAANARLSRCVSDCVLVMLFTSVLSNIYFKRRALPLKT